MVVLPSPGFALLTRNTPPWLSAEREEQVRPQDAVAVGHRRASAFFMIRGLTAAPPPGLATTSGTMPEEWKAQGGLHVLGGLQGVVEVLEQERQADPQAEAHDEGDLVVAPALGE